MFQVPVVRNSMVLSEVVSSCANRQNGMSIIIRYFMFPKLSKFSHSLPKKQLTNWAYLMWFINCGLNSFSSWQNSALSKQLNFDRSKNILTLQRASPAQPAPGQSPRVGTQQGYPVVAVWCSKLALFIFHSSPNFNSCFFNSSFSFEWQFSVRISFIEFLSLKPICLLTSSHGWLKFGTDERMNYSKTVFRLNHSMKYS